MKQCITYLLYIFQIIFRVFSINIEIDYELNKF